MKKNYLTVRYSSELLLYNQEGYFLGVLYRIILFILVLASAFFYAQDSIVDLENIHVIGNAVIVSQNTNEYTVTYITENSIKKVKLNSASEKDSKAVFYIANNENKKIKIDEKKIAKKTIKKILTRPKNILVYNKNSNSDESFRVSDFILKQGTTNHNDFENKFLNSENERVVYLKFYQTTENTLFWLYYSKNTKNRLSIRPPPFSIS